MYKLNLVDIDKVLDDFELNEDEIQGSGAAKSEASKNCVLNNTSDESSDTKTQESPVKQQYQQHDRKADDKDQSEPISSESFSHLNSNRQLNVSNVFSSLNEYVNLSLNETTCETIQDVESTTSINNRDTNNSNNFKYSEITDPEQEETEKNECVESFRKDNSNSSSPTSDTSSVTTASTRSSDGRSSSREDLLENRDSHFREDYDNANLITNDSDEDHELVTDPMKCELEKPVCKTNTNLPDSSISMGYSCLNTSEQVTSTQTAKDEFTITHQDTPSSSIVEINRSVLTENIESATLNNNTNNTNLEQSEMPEELVDPIPKIEQEPSEKIDRMAFGHGFESTMDDISDNELESFLGELEELEQEQRQKVDPLEKSADDEKNLKKLEEICDLNQKTQESSKIQESQEPAIAEEVVEIRKLKRKESETEEDRISQASTVECSERLESHIDRLEEEASEIKTSNEEEIMMEVDLPNKQDISEKAEVLQQLEIIDENIDSPEQPVEESEISTKSEPLERPKTLELSNTTAPAQEATENTAPQIDSDQGLTSSSDESSSGAHISRSPNDFQLGQEAEEHIPETNLGKLPPFWIPDRDASNCMQCNLKFSMLKRRHHCRACGLLLCSGCCCMKAKLEYLGDIDVRICTQCHAILNLSNNRSTESSIDYNDESQQEAARQPNPNNPMEYCSVIPPYQQVNPQQTIVPSVMVPVSVLKKRDSSSSSGGARKDKNVIFSDGIRPGCDLTELDENWSGLKPGTSSRSSSNRRIQSPPGTSDINDKKIKFNTSLPAKDELNNSFIPGKENQLPPVYSQMKTAYKFMDVVNDKMLLDRLETETLMFAVQRNFFVYCKIVKLSCCINKTVINFTTKGLQNVAHDEIIILLELDKNQSLLPKDVFLHLNEIYNEADKGKTISEYGFSLAKTSNFLGSKEHGGFLYIRPTFQCLQLLQLPDAPYLFGLLIHRWEIPWAKIFPLRLMLRLGALYRYYPCPLVSVRDRESVYAEIGQTILNLLADFRTFAYTIETIRGMHIHMEARKTSVLIPKNRYDQVIKVLNNSSEHIIAFGADFSKKADGHLVCIQKIDTGDSESMSYTTQAINIQGQERNVTGASFFILNGALKTNSGFTGKCSIVEDGLMVQILPTKMSSIRDSLRNMKNIEIICGHSDADEKQTEIVSIEWTENDVNFNTGVISPIDRFSLNGIPSIRVHRGLDYSNKNHMIRWTEVFIIKSDDDGTADRGGARSINEDQMDISKMAEQIAKSTCLALVSLLDLLVSNGMTRIGLRVTLEENVCYEAGSQFSKLAPLYMNALDNELVPTLHRQTSNLNADSSIVLELMFHILSK